MDENREDADVQYDDACGEYEDDEAEEPHRAPAPPLSPKLLRSRPPKPRAPLRPGIVGDLLGSPRPNKLVLGKVRIVPRRGGK